MKRLKRFGLAVLVVLVGLQFVPAGTNQSTDVPSTDFIKTYKVNDDISRILRNSCYNCHSNNTIYPWYGRIQPVGLFLNYHINSGKAELNFSQFGTYSARKQKSKLKFMAEQIEKEEMPLRSYTLLHREAVLSKESKKAILDYINVLKDSLQ